MELRAALTAKANELEKNAEVLKAVEVIWQIPITIDCSQLSDIRNDWYNKVLALLKKDKNQPAVYYFAIKSSQSNSTIINALRQYKLLKKNSCPKIPKNNDNTSLYLYCGSKKQKLYERFMQHLGYGSATTYALHLNRWANAIGLRLEFHYAWISDKDYTELVESALANEIKPLVGKSV